ncbi:hypothetical protein SKAU_G00411520 [Synaphobranchus kaupii]|uniref:Gypsy retrotransposon integrase-like protein 1 n=1 Tax=Synaphobranchus kaupii TaxID=118154 RepID=A0A9Q1E7V2_SYNKA|nr:hypothetical protein SKAU_G00411520 [Synaphobranchus kaupii]
MAPKDTPWHWGQEQDVAMRTLKDSISAAPALAFPDKTKPFILETAFTPLNISAVLKQQQDQQKRVVSYASKSLSPVEQRFTDCEKALFSAVWAIQQYRNLVCGAEIILETCHQILIYLTNGKLREGKVTNARIANWILATEGLSLQLKYAKSKNNAVAQGLAALHDCASLPHQPSEEPPPTDLPGLANHQSFSDLLCPTFPKVYVDGSAHRKTGTVGAGVGLVWTNCDLPPQKFKLGPKSSQYAELAGTLIALTQAAEHNYEHLVICTDSDYTVHSFIDYLPHWLANDMKKSDGKPVAHTELFIAIQHLLDTTNLTVFWKKIPGHSKLDGPDKAGNDRADALAKEGVSTGQPWEFCNPALQFSQTTDNSSVTIGTSELRNTQREADTPPFPQPPAQVEVVTRSSAKAPDPHNPSNSNRITLITPEAHNDLVQAQEKDQALTHLIRILQDTTSVADSGDLINDAYFQVVWKQKERLSLRDGPLTFKGTNDQHCRWVVPRRWRITMMQHAHDEPCGGHRGEQSTISMLRQVAYWPKMRTDVKDYVNSCLTCCKFQPVLPRHRAPLQSTPTTQPWSHIQIDWIGPIIRSSRGNQYALTVTDMFTKWVECLPAPRDTAESTAVLLMNHVFTRWGLPQSVHSDRGTHFTSTIMEQVWKTLGVKRQLYVAYRPQSSGQMVLPLHLLYTPTTGSAPEAVQTTSYLEELGRHLQSIFEFARQNMKTEAIGVKSYDRKACDREYEVGDEAFYYHFSRNQKQSKKLLPSWQGPYAITDKLSPVVYRIKVPTPRKMAHKWVHIN